MDGHDLLTLWSANALLSLAVWLVIGVAVLYLARPHAQRVLRAAAFTVITQARRLARAARVGARALESRARRALLQLARESVERDLSRQTQRLGATLARDLATFPHLHRQVHEQIQRIDEDYRSTVEAPPTPPEWLDAIETIAKLPARDDPSLGRMLEDMHATLDRACHESLLAYRAAGRRRHRVLKRMQPLWRRMDRSLASLQHTLSRLQGHTDRLDAQVAEYTEILSGRPSVVRRLAANLGIRVLLSGLVLAGLGAAAVVEYHLIARPLAEIGAGVGEVSGIPFTNVMAIVVLVLLALTGGLLLDTVRVTHLFPEMNWIDNGPRRLLAAVAAVLLVGVLAAAASLAWTRDYLLALDAAARAFPPAIETNFPSPVFHWIPAITHSLLALALGVAVSLTVLPVETLLRQGRVLVLGALALFMHGLALATSLLALLALQLHRLIAALYDLLIFLPLAGENALRQARGAPGVPRAGAGTPNPPDTGDSGIADTDTEDVPTHSHGR